MTIDYSSAGIVTTYPQLACGNNVPIEPTLVAGGRLEWIERIEFGSNCINGGRVTLTLDSDDWDFLWERGSIRVEGPLMFKCNPLCPPTQLTVAPNVTPTTSPVSADTPVPSAAPSPGPISATWERTFLIRGARNARWGWTVALSKDASTVLSGAYLSSTNGANSGLAAVYNLAAEEASEVAQVLGNVEDQLGVSVSLSGDGSVFAAVSFSGGYVGIYRTADSGVIDGIVTGT